MFKRQISAAINEGYNNSKSMLLIYGARQIGNYNYSRVFKEKQKNKLYWDKFNWKQISFRNF